MLAALTGQSVSAAAAVSEDQQEQGEAQPSVSQYMRNILLVETINICNKTVYHMNIKYNKTCVPSHNCLFLFSVIVTSSEDTKQDFQFFLKQPEKVESELQELFLLTQPRTVLCRGLNTEAESKQTKVTSVTPDDTEESTTVPTTMTCVFLI